LKSGTSIVTERLAQQALELAHRDFNAGAWLSAEASAWQAIQHAAQAIDQQASETAPKSVTSGTASAMTNLVLAKQAMIEARDFAGSFCNVNAGGITRMARSHQTDVLDGQPTAGMTGTEASDRYLDFARLQLAAIASRSVTAAAAMDLMAVIYLRRGEARTLPSATALCLRRAALQGQPNNPSLAVNLGKHLSGVGLFDEARWALEHAMSLDPNADTARALAGVLSRSGDQQAADAMLATITPKSVSTKPPIAIPEITQLSPQEFAALSQSVVWKRSNSASVTAQMPKHQATATPASAKLHVQTSNDEPVAEHTSEPSGTFGRIRHSWNRWVESVKSIGSETD